MSKIKVLLSATASDENSAENLWKSRIFPKSDLNLRHFYDR